MSAAPVTSEVLAAAVVVVLDVVAREDAPTAGPAVAPGPPGGPATAATAVAALAGERTGTVELEVVEVLKGRLDAGPGDRVSVPVTVRGSGRWSTAATWPGSRLVAFCGGGSTGLRSLLVRDAELQLVADDGVAADVRLVRAVQRRHPTADRLLTEAERLRAVAGAVFARYVWVSAREALRTSDARLDRLLRLAEDPGTRVDAQEAYLLAAYEDLTMTEEIPGHQRARLVVAMLRSALDPRLGERRTRLLRTHVPNLLTGAADSGTADGGLTPADVFAAAGDPGQGAALRDRVLAELTDPHDPATTAPGLLAWLDEREG